MNIKPDPLSQKEGVRRSIPETHNQQATPRDALGGRFRKAYGVYTI